MYYGNYIIFFIIVNDVLIKKTKTSTIWKEGQKQQRSFPVLWTKPG